MLFGSLQRKRKKANEDGFTEKLTQTLFQKCEKCSELIQKDNQTSTALTQNGSHYFKEQEVTDSAILM